MHIRTFPSPNTAASAAASLVADALATLATTVLALPTGRTPVPLYRALVARHREGRADFSRATAFSMDELLGLAPDHPGSYQTYLRHHLLQHVNLAPERIHLIRGNANDWRSEVVRIERQLGEVGGLDLAVVGIGMNGHVAFNEPAPALVARTHLVRLASSSRRAHAGPFGHRWQNVPTHALSMGIGTILSARRVLLVATGAHKAGIVRRALTGPVTTRVPASLLQVHPHVHVVLDKAAAAKLSATPPRVSRHRRPARVAD
jgi:glucosamine-6-phosphate deaminase